MRRKIKREGRELLFRKLEILSIGEGSFLCFSQPLARLRSFVFRASSREVVYVPAKFPFLQQKYILKHGTVSRST